MIYSDISTLAHEWWGMTCGFDVYVSMFWIKLDNLLVGYLGILKKEKEKEKEKKRSLIRFSLSNWASCLKALSVL